jgi:hypothetical protein
MEVQKTILAGSSHIETLGGLVLSILSASQSLQVSFGGRAPEPAQSGQVFDKRDSGGFTCVIFTNPNTTDVTVIYNVGDLPVNSSAAPAQQLTKLASTYAFGNLGMGAAGGTYNGQTIGTNASGATFKVGATYGQTVKGIFVTADNFLKISGTNNGNQRNLIALTSLAGNFYVCDPNKNIKYQVTSGTTVPTALATDAEVWLYSSPGDGNFTALICEIYFASK